MNFLNEARAEVGRDLDMLAEVTKTKLRCDMVFISVSKHDKLYSVGLDQNSSQVPSNRFHKALDIVCSLTAGQDKTIALEDATIDPAYSNLPYVSDGPIVAYLGVPLRTGTSQPYGAICAVSEKARKWEPCESAFLEHLSVVVSSLITKELQRGEMNLLHETIRETDLVLMTLAAEISSLISVHDKNGELLFSSLGLTRFSSESAISEAAAKLIMEAPFGEGVPRSIFDEVTSSTSFGTYLRTRSGELKQFETSVTLSSNGTYFLNWSPLDITNTH